MKKTQVIIVSVFGLLVLLVIWTISAMKGKEENQNTVRLSTDNKDVTITDVKAPRPFRFRSCFYLNFML